MTDVLIFGDTIRTPELRHEVPFPAPDGFLYAERNGDRYVFVPSMEIPRLQELNGNLNLVSLEELGLDELIAQGMRWHEADRELAVRACRRLGIEEAVTPHAFPLAVADHLRANGVSVRPDEALFEHRRRSKNDHEIAGIRRAQNAAQHAMDAIRARLRTGDVTSEDLRTDAMRAFTEAGATSPDIVIVSHGPQTAVGHEPGHGPIAPNEPIVVDLFPQDPDSGCFADMTRTFCLGEPPGELVEFHRLCLEALELVYPAIRPGVNGEELHRLASEVFSEAGHPTQLTKEPGQVLDEGFYHSLGHGVGLEVHENPLLGRNGQELVAGDVVAVEPGVYRQGFGGCRLEDLVLVTDDGYERLTDYPYDLAP